MKKIKYFFLTFLCAYTSINTSAQIFDYEFNFNIKGATDTVYLANYFGKQLYYADTAYTDKNGNFTFKNKKELMPGKFAVVFPGKTYFEIIINEPSFTIKSDTADLIGNMEITGSKENQLYIEYVTFLNDKRKAIEPLNKAYKDATKDKEKEEIKNKIIAIDQSVKDRQKEIAAMRNEFLIAQMIAMSVDIDVPESPKNEDGSVDSTFQYYYFRNHYFDLINLKNEAVVRCPEYPAKLDKFFDDVVLQHPDTLAACADKLIAKMDDKGDVFKFTVNHLINKYNKSKIMGMDAMFYHMAKNYYMNGRAFWADSSSVASISERATAIGPTLVGKPAPRLNLYDTTGKKVIPLYSVQSDYTILCFWSATCGHCKKAIPKLKKIYEKLKSHGVEVYGVGTELENKEWIEFIKKHDLNWINVSDTPERPNIFRTTYDIFSTPKVFILDKDKKIIVKQVGVEQAGDILKERLGLEDIDFGIEKDDEDHDEHDGHQH